VSAKPQFFRIGLFILLGLLVLAGALIAFGGGQLFRQKLNLETYLDASVQGIEVGSPVKFRGVQVGRVSSIGFVFNEYGDVAVESGEKNFVSVGMEIDKQIFPDMFTADLAPTLEKNIALGLRARIEPLGITGMNYIEIEFVDPKRYPAMTINWTPKELYIPSAPGELTDVLDSVNKIMREVEQFNIKGISDSGTSLLDNLNKAITEAQIGKISADVQALVVEVRSALDKANVGPLSDEARHLIDGLERSNLELQKALLEVNKIARNVEPASRISEERIRSIVRNLDETAQNLTTLSNEVRNRPSLLLWGSPPKPKPSGTPAKKR